MASAVNNNATAIGTYEQDNLVVDQAGFKSIIQSEANTFLNNSDSRLLLNHTVTNIRYNSEGVIISTSEGDVIEADYAICTFSYASSILMRTNLRKSHQFLGSVFYSTRMYNSLPNCPIGREKQFME